ncbi:hypothetical protein VSX64_11140 [Aurantimonas sp. C2-6-R+9]|uniref:hypothetical protein n=1 Tax=unclassified Aurantimonas TaxID=2638230 RepID=UPI002E18F574|nr:MULTISPECIES: hypothetical protein [unclassified Aurantimonas]MEC5291105.1 hypothetical protein [Aurantimonas sp. C2-3-R2]MEC5381433.1 hypothetical protein [Aurantimonas sp. C2-6-R+9]MEC5412256.1 hypothetical protein [Aurantimonas sp. C2-4-R8]
MSGKSLTDALHRARRRIAPMLAGTVVLAGAVVLTASGWAFAAPPTAEASADPSACVGRYHAALVAIGQSEYPKIKAARTIAFKGDDNLAGALIFAPLSRPRNSDEMAALRQATAQARARGRATWLASSDKRWIADRIVTELGEYLTQDESPYLCGGVPDYLATVRSYASRVASVPAEPAESLTIQREAARRAIRQAYAAMLPVPVPRFAPTARGDDLIAGLRPSKGAERMAAFLTPAAHSIRKRVYGPEIDPDLPPLAMAEVTPLASDRDRLAALDGLVAAARAGGFTSPPKRDVAATGSVGEKRDAEDAHARPVLARLAALKSLVVGKQAAIGDPLVRRALLAAFAEIEALDYLAHRPTGGDPMLAAIEATLSEIEAAHAKACDCAD